MLIQPHIPPVPWRTSGLRPCVPPPWGCCSARLVQPMPSPVEQLQAPASGFPAIFWMGFVPQGLEALSGPRSSSITRRAAGFPVLFLCIVSGEAPSQARPLLTHCVQTLLALANTALPQDWDQTLDLPQVRAVAGSVACLGTG